MDRAQQLQAGLSQNKLGLEIGPLHNPICPKKDGWKILTMDVLPTNKVKERYINDPAVDVSLIEDVDIIFTGSLSKSLKNYGLYHDENFADPTNCLDYIISSHNFEHQPDPIQFLIDCQRALRDNGILSMAIPIGSRSFDCWNPLTTTGEWIDAFYAQYEKPSCGKIFNSHKNMSSLVNNMPLNNQTYSFENVTLKETFDSNYLNFLCHQNRKNVYVDAHCSVVNPFSFQLLFEDVSALGLLQGLKIKEIKINGSEFIASLIKSQTNIISPEDNIKRRTILARKSIEFQHNDLIKS